MKKINTFEDLVALATEQGILAEVLDEMGLELYTYEQAGELAIEHCNDYIPAMEVFNLTITAQDVFDTFLNKDGKAYVLEVEVGNSFIEVGPNQYVYTHGDDLATFLEREEDLDVGISAYRNCKPE